MIKKIDYKLTLPIRQKVLWPTKTLESLTLDVDPEGMHYGYYLHSTLVGVISLFIKNNSAQFRKFAVLQENQKQGIGSKLLEHVINECIQLGVEDLWCNARTTKVGFYDKFGLKNTEKTFSRGDVQYIILKRKIKDA